MPALVLFGHRTRLAGDDLQISCVFVMMFRLAQLGVLIPLLVYRIQVVETAELIQCRDQEDDKFANFKQDGGIVFVIYWILALLLIVTSLLIEAMICYTSNQGTPTEPEKRTKLVPLCTVKLVPISVVRITLFVLGFIMLLALANVCDCLQEEENQRSLITDFETKGDSGATRSLLIDFHKECSGYDKFYTCLAVLVLSQFLELCFLGVFVTCCLFGSVRPRQRLCALLRKCCTTNRQLSWKRTCQFCCTCSSLATCCLFGGKESGTRDYADISLVLADYFADGGMLDITFSDIIAGLVMLSRSHQERRIECRKLIRQAEIEKRLEIETIQKAEQRDNGAGATAYNVELGTEESEQIQSESEADVENAEKDNGAISFAIQDCDMDDDKQQGPKKRRRSSLTYLVQRDGSQFEYNTVARDVLSKENASDVAAIAEGAHFINVSIAIYAWMMYVKNHPYTAHCTFVGSWVRNAVRCRVRQNMVIGDNCCGWNETALWKEAGLEQPDIAYAQFRVGFAATPYCIAMDHDWKTIVLAIRGTSSIDDLAVDVSIRPESLEEVGERCGFDGRGEFCHEGILVCANWIYADLTSHGILNELLLGSSAKHPGYRLRIVGHSLGAGVAAILGLMLRGTFPNLRCVCFEPPGCVLSMGMARACKSYMTSFVHDMDIVPRMSLESMENIRNDVLEMIARIKVPKHNIFHAGVSYRGANVVESNEEMLYKRESIPASEFSRQFAEYKERQEQRKRDRDRDDVVLYPPGKIVYMTRMAEAKPFYLKRLLSNPEQFAAQWALNGDFSEIQLSAHMLVDHDPANVRLALEQLASSFGLTPPYATKEALNA